MASQSIPNPTNLPDAQVAAANGLPISNGGSLAAFHGAADHIKVGVCSILGIGLAEREAQARFSTESRSKHTTDTSEESISKRARISTLPSMAESIDFGSVINPTVPIHCVVQVNDGAPVGSWTFVKQLATFDYFEMPDNTTHPVSACELEIQDQGHPWLGELTGM